MLCLLLYSHVQVVDGAFVSSSEITRLAYLWHQVSRMKSAGGLPKVRF